MKGQVMDFVVTVLYIVLLAAIILVGIVVVTLAAGQQLQQSFAFRQEIAQNSGIVQGLLALKRGDRSVGEIVLQSTPTGLAGAGADGRAVESLIRDIASGFDIRGYGLSFGDAEIDSTGLFCGDARVTPQLLAWCEPGCAPGRILRGDCRGQRGLICCAEAYNPAQLRYTVGFGNISATELTCGKTEAGRTVSGICELGGCSPGRQELTDADVSTCDSLFGTLPAREPVLTKRFACCRPVTRYEPEPRPPSLADIPIFWKDVLGSVVFNLEVKAA